VSGFDDDDVPKTGAISLADIEQLRSMAAEKNRSACVRALSGMRLGHVFRIEDRPLTIGRSPACHIHLDEPGVSRVHARIEKRDGGAVIVLKDNGSTNGTFVNGSKVDERPLVDGDTIQVGAQTMLRFALQDQLEEQFQQHQLDSATRDSLTGLFSKRYLMEQLEAEISFCKRHERLISLAMVDADHFKNVNDTLGHLAGDHVLRELSRVMTTCVRNHDVLARYGGEEFAVIMRDTPPDRAHVVGNRIRERVELTPIEWEGKRIPVTVSVGIAGGPARSINEMHELIAAADRYLYDAKHQGRNRVVIQPWPDPNK
jgi:diguanylate cyclase (GGDEF)-like protein